MCFHKEEDLSRLMYELMYGEPGHIISFHLTKPETSSTSIRLRAPFCVCAILRPRHYVTLYMMFHIITLHITMMRTRTRCVHKFDVSGRGPPSFHVRRVEAERGTFSVWQHIQTERELIMIIIDNYNKRDSKRPIGLFGLSLCILDSM